MNKFVINTTTFFQHFRLELNGHRRRLTWEATPRSIHEGKIEFYVLRVFAAKARCKVKCDLEFLRGLNHYLEILNP